jgi:hypothetical protein
MIRYHGTPITPAAAAVQILKGRHGLVSFEHPEQIGLVAEMCQSFVLDNGAFSHWRAGKGEVDCRAYAAWVRDWYRHPGFDWCLIPDVIDGDESRNTDLINGWVADNRDIQSVPVWHLHESLDWLRTLIGMFPRIALGSSGEYSQPGSKNWEVRMNEAMEVLCDSDGRPKVKIHGLRMMDPTIFSRFPLASVDSCNVARNIGIDASWESFKYGTALRKSVRGVVMAQHCEDHASATVWRRSREEQYRLLFG